MSDAVGSIDSGSSGVELFDSPRQCWRVTGASLDVFAVPVNAAGEQVETGRYLFTMESGQVGFGVAPCPLAGDTRLAIRTRRTSEIAVCTLSWSPFEADGTVSANMVEAIDQWLIRLAGCLPNGDPPDMFAEPNGDAATGGGRGPYRPTAQFGFMACPAKRRLAVLGD